MKQVVVLRGGPSEEYHVSMLSGQAVLAALTTAGYSPQDIVITKTGQWLQAGFVRQPSQVLQSADVVFVALHGKYGEDGQVQRLLERFSVPFTGSRALASAIAFNKAWAKDTLTSHNLTLPRHRRLTRDQLTELRGDISELIADIGTELFLKPISGGSSLGVRAVSGEFALQQALMELFELYDDVLVEETIRGREATVGVLENFRSEELYVLPAIEVVPPDGDKFYDATNKYNGTTDHICPGRFSCLEKSALAQAACTAHRALGCSQYSRSDFIVRDGKVFYLETNTLPGFTEHSNYPLAAAAVGLPFPQLVAHLVETAMV